MQINARDWIFEVSLDPTAGTPVWAQVGGLESFELDTSEGEESADTTTFESAGVAESQAMQRGAKLQLSGKVKRTGSSQDAGQAAAESLATEVGEDSLGGIRFRHVDDTTWTQWNAWASLGTKGGGNNDKTTWAASFMRSGAATTPAVA
jgi:hypothetical protein